MSRQRCVQDSFWTDPYIEKLSPDYKLAFLYLLTNPLCNIAGVYEIRSKRIAYETGYDIEVIENILARFANDNKILRHGDWIILINHLKHQNLGNDTAKGVNRIILEAPEKVQSLFELQEMINSKGDRYDVMVIKQDLFDTPYRPPTLGRIVRNKVKDIVINKVEYGEFENVKLTDEEYTKLIEKIGEQRTKSLIEELSTYMASKGKRYSSHYATIQNWDRMKSQKNNSRGKSISVIE